MGRCVGGGGSGLLCRDLYPGGQHATRRRNSNDNRTGERKGRGRVHKDGVMLEVVRGREALVIEFSR